MIIGRANLVIAGFILSIIPGFLLKEILETYYSKGGNFIIEPLTAGIIFGIFSLLCILPMLILKWKGLKKEAQG